MELSRRDFVKLMLTSTALEPTLGLAQSTDGPRVATVLVEWQQRPLALDTPRPRFRWTLAAPSGARGMGQSSFRLTITDERERVVFDTARSATTTMAVQPTRDLPLQSQHRYRYALQVWDQDGHALPVASGSFATGLLGPANKRGQWLSDAADEAPRHAIEGRGERVDQATPLPLFRKRIQVRKPVRYAHLCIAGLGQYQLWIDGEKISPDGLNGGWTNYDKRVLYDAYEVSGQLAAGEHLLGVALGNGFFNNEALEGRYSKINGGFGRAQLWCQLRLVYTDGSDEIVGSDGSWETSTGGTLYSSIYGGEDYDTRLDGGKAWGPVTVIAGPVGALEGSTFRPMVVRRSLPPRSATPLPGGGIVYDFGLNHSGRPRVRFRNLQPGAVIRLIPAELLGADGSANQQSMVGGGKDQGYRGIAFTYTARGGASESWSPQFTYTGYRYLQVDGVDSARIDSVESHFLSADLATTGSFACSDQRMEDIHHLIQQALLSNSASVLTDCPHREKLGWLEQIYLNAATALLNSDMVRVYEKMAADIRDAQEADGKIPTTAPEFIKFLDRHGKDTIFRDSPEWGAALILGAWSVYRLHGDLGILRQNYGAMQRRLAFMATRQDKDGLIHYGLGDWFDFGPRKPGVAQLTSLAMTGTATYYAELRTMAEIARKLGEPDADAWAATASAVRHAILDRLFDPARSILDTGSQTAQSMGLVLGLFPPAHRARALDVLIADIRARNNHVSAGDIGFHYVVRALTDGGRSDVLFDMLRRTDKPAYLEQIRNGATALTEAWDGSHQASQNHFMLGHAEIWFYQGLGGLDLDFSRRDGAITLAPQAVDGILDQAAHYDSAFGRIACRLRREGRDWHLSVEIPPGQSATIVLPMASPAAVRESGASLSQARGIRDIKEAGKDTVLTATSGRYAFAWVSA
jgi:alpha-L-rhamnosidase